MPQMCAGSFDEELLSGYLDGSLTQAETLRVRLHLESCEACQTLLGEMRALRAATSSTEFAVPGADQWPELPKDLWSRATRRLGWTLTLAWALAISGVTCWQLLAGNEDPFRLLRVLGLPGGLGMLAFSVLVDRLRMLRASRYRGAPR